MNISIKRIGTHGKCLRVSATYDVAEGLEIVNVSESKNVDEKDLESLTIGSIYEGVLSS
tara:strand:+ start:367 stop:543 length:177 start_codon:yes stop_codon:yes gene_type:complete